MAGVGGPIGSVLLLGVNDETTYRWFHESRGTGSIDANADGWRGLGDVYDKVLLLVALGLSESRASWSGAAGDAAAGAVSPVRAWAEQALDSAVRSYGTVQQQSQAFSDIKGRLSPPVAVPDKPWLNDMWPGETNYDKALAAKQANSSYNLELVRQYGDMTETNSASYPVFDTPVEVTTDVSRQPEQPTQPVQPGDRGSVGRPAGPRGASGGEPASPGGGPGQPAQPAAVVGPGQPGGGPSGQTVNPSQSVPGGQSPPVVTPPPVPGQDPVPGRNPVTGVPVAGSPGARGTGVPGGGRVPGERGGQPGSGGRAGGPGGGAPEGGRPGSGGRFGGVPAGEAVAGRGGPAGGVGRGGAGQPGGFVPGAGSAAGDEDTEHTNRFGPVDTHDEFWEAGVPLVAPPVIGGPEEDE